MRSRKRINGNIDNDEDLSSDREEEVYSDYIEDGYDSGEDCTLIIQAQKNTLQRKKLKEVVKVNTTNTILATTRTLLIQS